ncbi:BTB/POZ domain-containing protein 2-like [Montipora foliosa]|uniref:BTB/POZ domain-containing protein 2-like n=1 Tax=Montipora foliosa TaxID=591990 RepID=UPI0035F1C7D2
MSLREENWQTKKPTIRERTKFMFNNGLFSDVKFVVRKSDGESESKQAIPAHKLMLAIGSPVFEAMFYGELAETSDSVELPDCEYDSLLELFRYLYSDEVNLSGSNVMEVLYLSKKYIVPSLAAKCTKYLQDRLDPIQLVERDTLNIQEVELFKGVVQWADKGSSKTSHGRRWTRETKNFRRTDYKGNSLSYYEAG